MSVVSNQLPYTLVNPPAEPKNTYPLLMALVQRVAFVILIGGFSAAFGVAIGMHLHVVSLVESAILGAFIGSTSSLPLIAVSQFPTVVESYRQGCLEEIEKGMSNPRALAALRNLKGFFYYRLKRFSHYYNLYLFYNEIAAVTEKLDPERPDVVKGWDEFLHHLNGIKVKMPGGEEVTLDFSHEFSKMRGGRRQVSSTWLTNRFVGPDHNSLKEIYAIQTEAAAPCVRHYPKDIMQIIRQNPNSHIIVSRDSGTGKIVGYCWYLSKGPELILIAALARKPNYPRFGIGSELLGRVLGSIDQRKRVQLHVREGNPAFHLYRKWGFAKVGIIRDYYPSGPKENAFLMELNWDRYNAILSRQ